MKNWVLGLCFAVVACFGSSVFASEFPNWGKVTNNSQNPILVWTSGNNGAPGEVARYVVCHPGESVGNGAGGVGDADYYYDPVDQKWRKIDGLDYTVPNLWPHVVINYEPASAFFAARNIHRYYSPTVGILSFGPDEILPLQGPGPGGYAPNTPPTWTPIPSDMLPYLWFAPPAE